MLSDLLPYGINLDPTSFIVPMSLPPRFIDLKGSIASSYPDFEARATNAWHEIIAELDKVTKVIKEERINVGH